MPNSKRKQNFSEYGTPATKKTRLHSINNMATPIDVISLIDNENDTKSEEEPPCCAICYNEYPAREGTNLNPCKHAFCFTCIFLWLQEKRACPLCRTVAKSYSHNLFYPRSIKASPLPASRFPRNRFDAVLPLRAPLLQLVGRKDVWNCPEFPEAFLNTVFKRSTLPSGENMYLMFYLIDSIELVHVDDGPQTREIVVPRAANMFLMSQLPHLCDTGARTVLSGLGEDFLQKLVANMDNRAQVEQHNLTFHRHLEYLVPHKFARKLWELLIAYIRFVLPRQVTEPTQAPSFYFGLRHQNKQVQDEILFPARKKALLASIATQDRLMQLLLSHFKAVMRQKNDVSERLRQFMREHMEMEGVVPCAVCPEDILVKLFKCYKSVLLMRYQHEMCGLPLPFYLPWSSNCTQSQQEMIVPLVPLRSISLYAEATFLPLSPTGSVGDILETVPPQQVNSLDASGGVLSRQIASVMDRLQHRQRLQSAQYQRNRARNFIQLLAEEHATTSENSALSGVVIDLTKEEEEEESLLVQSSASSSSSAAAAALCHVNLEDATMPCSLTLESQ